MCFTSKTTTKGIKNVSAKGLVLLEDFLVKQNKTAGWKCANVKNILYILT